MIKYKLLKNLVIHRVKKNYMKLVYKVIVIFLIITSCNKEDGYPTVENKCNCIKTDYISIFRTYVQNGVIRTGSTKTSYNTQKLDGCQTEGTFTKSNSGDTTYYYVIECNNN